LPADVLMRPRRSNTFSHTLHFRATFALEKVTMVDEL
jgi:hypothetical protein